MKQLEFTKENGAIWNRDSILFSLDSIFKTIANGNYTVSVKRDVKKRTLDQNALMWLWFTCISRETGSNIQDVHDYYCTVFLSRKAIISGREVLVKGGTSKLNTAAFTHFLNNVQADAAQEFGIVLPTPDDLRFAEFKDEYERYLNY